MKIQAIAAITVTLYGLSGLVAGNIVYEVNSEDPNEFWLGGKEYHSSEGENSFILKHGGYSLAISTDKHDVNKMQISTTGPTVKYRIYDTTNGHRFAKISPGNTDIFTGSSFTVWIGRRY